MWLVGGGWWKNDLVRIGQSTDVNQINCPIKLVVSGLLRLILRRHISFTSLISMCLCEDDSPESILIETSSCNLKFFSKLITTQLRNFTWYHHTKLQILLNYYYIINVGTLYANVGFARVQGRGSTGYLGVVFSKIIEMAKFKFVSV